MRGMILAAGRGQRMGELTDSTPKALLRVSDNYLIEYSIRALSAIGINEIVINTCYHGAQIKTVIGDGKNYGVTIQYSEEEYALETGGGIYQALPLLGSQPFIVLSCDVISDFALHLLPAKLEGLAHIVLVDNPDFNLKGDFNLVGNQVNNHPPCSLTYANIGVFHPDLFAECKHGKFKLGDVLKHYVKQRLVTGERHHGFWCNLGTKQQLFELNETINPIKVGT